MKNTFFIFLYFLSITTFAQTPNWSNSIAKILYANCTSCHRPGDIAPFSLTTYQNAYDYAESIEYAVSNGEMPPWTADPNYKHFAHERDSQLFKPTRAEYFERVVVHGIP